MHSDVRVVARDIQQRQERAKMTRDVKSRSKIVLLGKDNLPVGVASARVATAVRHDESVLSSRFFVITRL